MQLESRCKVTASHCRHCSCLTLDVFETIFGTEIVFQWKIHGRRNVNQFVILTVSIFGILSINCLLFSVIFDFNIYILYCLFLVNDFNGFNDGTPSGTNRSFNRISKSNNIQINFLNEGAIDNYLFYMRDRNA